MAPIGSLVLLDCVAAFAFTLIVTWYYFFRTRKLHLPPGPPTLPVIGNLFDIPKKESWKIFARWGKAYGDIISLRVFGQTLVVVNSVKAAKDLFERRGAIYSERPRMPILESDMIGVYDWSYSMFPSNRQWRIGRKIAEQGMRSEAMQKYWPQLEVKAHQLLRKVLHSPVAFREHIRYFDDDLLSLAEDFMDTINKVMLPGAVLVNDIPFLRYLPGWLPGMGFKKLAAKCKEVGFHARHDTYDYVKARMADGTTEVSLVRDLLEVAEGIDNSLVQNELAIIDSVGTLYDPGADTTASALSVLFLALALNPDVQDRAQEELDRVIGDGKLPSFNDRAALPYVEAVYKETLRWKPPAPLALPHQTARDDVYDGYFIPKGATVLGNVWSILHDPESYPNPESFNPSRFIDAEGKVIDDPKLSFVFGFGRRICPGRHLIESSFWIFTVSVLFAFRVAPAKDDMGREIPLSGKLTDGLVCHPESFKCCITPRNARIRDLVEASESS